MSEQLKSPDDWARHFKLHSCIGNKKFAKQIKEIQENQRLVTVELYEDMIEKFREKF